MTSLIALWATTLTGLPGQNPTSPAEALAALKAGNQRFARGESRAQPLGEGLRRTLVSGQSPFAIVVTCADSRVAPEHLFNAGLGELFVIRTAGNVCDPETLASIEYAVEHLGTPLCIVMGHEHCGAIAAATAGVQESPALDALLNRISPSVRKLRAEGLSGRELNTRVEEENAQHSIAEALRRSELLRTAALSDRFQILAARYLLSNGKVEWLPERSMTASAPAKESKHERRAQMVRGLPPHVAMSMLRAGHRRFLAENGQQADIGPTRRELLLAGQRPVAVVIACADSRVSPEHVFDFGLGELFVIRVAGNVLNDEVLASVEYAVEHTGASLVLVLGHSGCGAVTAAVEHGHTTNLSPSLRSLLGRIEPAIRHAKGEGFENAALIERSVEINAQRVADLMLERSQILERDHDEGLISVLAAVYELGSGDLRWLGKRHHLAAGKPSDGGEVHAGSPLPAPMIETHASPEHGPEVSGLGSDFDHDSGFDSGHRTKPAAAADYSDLLRILFAATMISTGGVLFLVLRRRDRIEIEPD